MKYYSDLLAMGCFGRDDVTQLTGNYNTAGTLLKRGYVRSVKRNLYVAVNLADNEPVVKNTASLGESQKQPAFPIMRHLNIMASPIRCLIRWNK